MSRSMKSALAALVVATTGFGPVAIAKENHNEISKESDGRIEIGYLTCEYREGSNIVVKADRKFDCIFNGAGDEFTERYTADATTVGLDLMVTEEKTMRWAVLAPSSFDEHGVLEGNYGGVSADAAFGYGLGADVLVGGLEESIALQPVAVSTGKGLGAAIGYEQLTLTYEGLGDRA